VTEHAQNYLSRSRKRNAEGKYSFRDREADAGRCDRSLTCSRLKPSSHSLESKLMGCLALSNERVDLCSDLPDVMR
jgi:hypothetical protein